MNDNEALEVHTRISTAEAHAELAKHGYEGMVMSGEFYARTRASNEFQRITIVYRGEIKSRPLMLWMGY